MKLNVLVLLLATISSCYGYHVLVLSPAPSHSHNSLGKGIVDALLKHGHTVTWASPFPEKTKNPPKTLTILDISSVQKYVTGVDMTDERISSRGIAFVKEFSNNCSIEMLNTPSVRNALIKQQFDAVVTEAFFADILAGVAAVQQAPWIVLATQLFPDLEAQVDEVRSIPTTPILFNTPDVPMSFVRRAINAFMYIGITIGKCLDRSSTIKLYEDNFGPIAAARGVTLPPFDDAYYNVSILFINTHESIALPYSKPPNAINIAGYHMDEKIPPLPKDLQELLDGSPQGVVYFSMGSVLRSAALKPHTRAALLRLFSSLPYTVLWKFEEELTGLPPNVHVRPWLPQPSILAHPNIKVFITHGGQLSSLEAIRAGVPLLAIPVFGDQPGNAEKAKRRGYALKVDFNPDMAPELEVALKEILSNDKYMKQAKYLSKIFQNRPSTPKDTINHYIELAIETKGAYHLRSLSLQYKWYERWMLDVILALLAVLAAVIALIVFLIKTCVRKISGTKTYKEKGSKKKRN